MRRVEGDAAKLNYPSNVPERLSDNFPIAFGAVSGRACFAF
jgi:hypothetical protein